MSRRFPVKSDSLQAALLSIKQPEQCKAIAFAISATTSSTNCVNPVHWTDSIAKLRWTRLETLANVKITFSQLRDLLISCFVMRRCYHWWREALVFPYVLIFAFYNIKPFFALQRIIIKSKFSVEMDRIKNFNRITICWSTYSAQCSTVCIKRAKPKPGKFAIFCDIGGFHTQGANHIGAM